MPNEVKITSVKFENFKAFRKFSVSLRNINVLVGPNNSGKSTILGAFRVLSTAIRRARSRKAEWLELPIGEHWGYKIPEDSIPISIENVHTDYDDSASTVKFRLSNGNSLLLYFALDCKCYLIPIASFGIRRPVDFKREFPLTIGLVPVLGPLEHNEEVVEEGTVKKALQTHRASRHFRNYWRYYPDDFDMFSEMIKKTWPGMEILKPEKTDLLSKTLQMYCKENRMSRELYWAGFGFQIWCQLLTHLCRAQNNAIVIIDEPEIYLHPDIQRQLLGILHDLGPDILIASHSTEIMTEADPSEILFVDKNRSSAKRISDIRGIQLALDAIGSIQNITLTRLARDRRILFVEGNSDFKIIRLFARKIGLQELASSANLTTVKSEGFTSWERIKSLAWGIERTLGQQMIISAVFDRDYWCEDEIKKILKTLNQHLSFAHIHNRKEIENYLLIPSVLDKAIQAEVDDRARRGGNTSEEFEPSAKILARLTEPYSAKLKGQYIAKHVDYHREKGHDPASLTAEALEKFEHKWKNIETRLEIVNGKSIHSHPTGNQNMRGFF